MGRDCISGPRVESVPCGAPPLGSTESKWLSTSAAGQLERPSTRFSRQSHSSLLSHLTTRTTLSIPRGLMSSSLGLRGACDCLSVRPSRNAPKPRLHQRLRCPLDQDFTHRTPTPRSDLSSLSPTPNWSYQQQGPDPIFFCLTVIWV